MSGKLELDKAPYTIDCLPYGIVSTATDPEPRCSVAIGSHAIDLAIWARERAIDGVPLRPLFKERSLNAFAAQPWSLRKQVRAALQEELRNGSISSQCLLQLSDVENHLPMKTGGFSDFYTSLEHCQNCSGEMSSSSIAKNWWYAPSVYNSRASSILPTPSSIPRPKNVSFTSGPDSTPTYGATRKLDYELEMGFYISQPIPHGTTLPIQNAKTHIFGFVMLNDWSARDHQLFEMRPLGPFHSKGFGTSVSNWVVPMEALERFACAPSHEQDPKPFEHLAWPGEGDGALDVKLRVLLRREGKETVLGTSNLRYLYWQPFQQLAHHAASGCGMETGDLIGTGTISGSGTDGEGRKVELGCLYEAERTGTKVLPEGSGSFEKGYLEDGDEVVMEGWCEDGEGRLVLGFGECRGTISPAREQ